MTVRTFLALTGLLVTLHLAAASVASPLDGDDLACLGDDHKTDGFSVPDDGDTATDDFEVNEPASGDGTYPNFVIAIEAAKSSLFSQVIEAAGVPSCEGCSTGQVGCNTTIWTRFGSVTASAQLGPSGWSGTASIPEGAPFSLSCTLCAVVSPE